MDLTQLQPSEVWKFFSELCKIPRPSGHEERVAEYIVDFARNKGFQVSRDAVGNVFVHKTGRKPVIALQAHMDMVCEKNKDVGHDFMRDPIKPLTDGKFVTADGTTLGADDGIGVAMILAALDMSDRELECLFTVQEETSLAGANALQPGLFTAGELINLDTGCEKEVIIGCAGTSTLRLVFDARLSDIPDGMFAVRIKIGGLAGGHSGEDINKNRANAVKLLAVFLDVLQNSMPYCLCDINGGGLSNAIAREAEAVVAVPFEKKEEVRILWNVYVSQIEDEWKKYEEGLKTSLESCPLPKQCFDGNVKQNLTAFLTACPHGVIEQDKTVQGIVDGSANLASVRTGCGKVVVINSQRHFDFAKMQMIASEISNLAEKYGACTESAGAYPGWQPDFDNPLVTKVVEAYESELGFRPTVMPIHAGLECACFAKLYPRMKAVSIGPDMWGIHSPDEKLSVESVGRIWRVLQRILSWEE